MWPWRCQLRGIFQATHKWHGKSLWNVWLPQLQVVIYFLWQEHNNRCFCDNEWSPTQITYQIQSHLSFMRFPRSLQILAFTYYQHFPPSCITWFFILFYSHSVWMFFQMLLILLSVSVVFLQGFQWGYPSLRFACLWSPYAIIIIRSKFLLYHMSLQEMIGSSGWSSLDLMVPPTFQPWGPQKALGGPAFVTFLTCPCSMVLQRPIHVLLSLLLLWDVLLVSPICILSFEFFSLCFECLRVVVPFLV